MRKHTAPAHTHEEDAPLNLQEVYSLYSTCGYTNDVQMNEHEAARLAGRLRAICAVAGVLMTDNGTDAALGDYLRSGLTQAVHLLSLDSLCDLEKASDRTAKAVQKEVAHHA